jgi:threonine dehydrogenase-like Zn-dependent dehydrogenase
MGEGKGGEIDPGFLTTHKIRLEDGPDAYKMFQEKTDGCIKVVINP